MFTFTTWRSKNLQPENQKTGNHYSENLQEKKNVSIIDSEFDRNSGSLNHYMKIVHVLT